MPITVYVTRPSAPCRAVLMTAKHLGIKVNVKRVDLMAGEQFKPDYLKMNPAHCVPTLDDDGFYLWESRAIMTYLVNKYAPDSSLYPKDLQKRAVVDKMLYFDIGTLYMAIANYVFPHMFEGQPLDPKKEDIFKKVLTLFDELLGKSAYAAGDHLTLADLSLFSSLTFIEGLLDYDLRKFSKVFSWMNKLTCELPYHKEINEEPLKILKAMHNQQKLCLSN